ncbi:MAG: histidine kinase, partial [Chloroflexota bacterium]|nr:histidine kinase [Chloroflexota bacterium]
MSLRPWSLRTRFIFFALACLVPLLVVVLFFLDRGIRYNTEQSIANENTIASLIERSLVSYFDRNVTALENLSRTEAIASLEAADADRLLGQATTVRPEISSLFLVDAEGQPISQSTTSSTDLLGLPVVSEQFTQTMSNRQIRISDDIQTSEETTVIVITVPVVTVSDTRTTVTEPVPADPTDGDPTTVAQTTETTPPGQVVGGIGAVYQLEDFEQIVVPFAQNRTEIAVVTESDVFLATSGVRREEQAFLERQRSIVERAIDGEPGDYTTEDAEGNDRIGVYRPVTYEGSTWAIIVTSPTSSAFAQNFWMQGLIVLVLAAVVILTLAVVLGELTARPIRTLARKAAALAHGDFSTPIEPIGAGEIRSLSSTLAGMSHQLQAQVQGLEDSRAEREQQTHQMRDLLRRTLRLQEDERRRIAGEIHDAVSPLITGALYQARALQMTNGSTPPEERDHSLNSVNHLLERASEELHGVIFDLRPPDLDDIGVVAAIEAYVQSIQRSGLMYRLEMTAEPPGLTPDVRLGIYRIVQEALHNVMRHSGADEAVIRLESTDVLLRVTIRDNGSGFDPATAVRPTSLGLLSMRERAAAISATFT